MTEDRRDRACPAPALPHQRAFLLQLAIDAVPADGALRGRAVHIGSGEAVPFENVAELCRFLDTQLQPATPVGGENRIPKGDPAP